MPNDTELQQAPTMDIEAAVEDIAAGIGLTPEPSEEPAEVQTPSGDEPAPLAATPPAEPAPVVEPVPAEPAVDTPHTWRKEAKDAWATLPPVIKEEVTKREADIQRYVESVKTPVAVGSKFQEIVGPYMGDFARTGTNVFENYAAMLQMQKTLAFGAPADKVELIKGLARTAGIALDGTTLSAPDSASQDYIRALEQRLARVEGGVSTVASSVREAQIQELSVNVLAFLQDKENHPYAEELADDMNALIGKGLATNLDEAYKQAVLASPVHRQKTIDAETEKRMAARLKEDAARVSTAKAASAANVRSNGSRRAAAPSESLDDTLKNALADINSRVH